MKCTLCWREWTGSMQDEQCMDAKQFFIIFLSHIHVCKEPAEFLFHVSGVHIMKQNLSSTNGEAFWKMKFTGQWAILQWPACFLRVSDRVSQERNEEYVLLWVHFMQRNAHGAGHSPNKHALTMGKSITTISFFQRQWSFFKSFLCMRVVSILRYILT
jgi:hypothetical protein